MLRLADRRRLIQCDDPHQPTGEPVGRVILPMSMIRILALPVLIALLGAIAAEADERAAAGKLLVATDEVGGEIFARTVILLLHYDESGAMGLVVNRPTDVAPEEVMDDPDELSGYDGTLFWGGPVEMAGLRVLVRSESPPVDATTIIDEVHVVPFDSATDLLPADTTTLRLYIGYAGWAPGQLDGELDIGSWDVQDATGEAVFSGDPRGLWEDRKPVREYRAMLLDTVLEQKSFARRVF